MRTLAILCGGRGTRLGGVDKGALLVEGEPILSRLARLRPSVDDAFLVTASAGPPRFGLRCVPDVEPGRGAPGGVWTALSSSAPGWVLVVGCDMPFVTPAIAEALFSRAGEELDAVAVCSAGGLEPLLTVYSTRLASEVRQLVDGGRSLRSLLARARVREVPLEEVDPEGRAAVGINTSEEARRWGAVYPDPSAADQQAGEPFGSGGHSLP